MNCEKAQPEVWLQCITLSIVPRPILTTFEIGSRPVVSSWHRRFRVVFTCSATGIRNGHGKRKYSFKWIFFNKDLKRKPESSSCFFSCQEQFIYTFHLTKLSILKLAGFIQQASYVGLLLFPGASKRLPKLNASKSSLT